MKKLFANFLIILFPLFLLTGCPGTFKENPVIVYKVVTPPVELTALCEVSTPPDKSTYMNATVEERERLLWEYSMKQTKNLFICNTRLVEIPKWKLEQEKIYLDQNPKPK